MEKVPTGNLDLKCSAAKTPTRYRAKAPSAPPVAINKYRLKLELLCVSLKQYPNSVGYKRYARFLRATQA